MPRVRRAGVVLAMVIGALAIGAGIAFRLTRIAPAWWDDAVVGNAPAALEFENAVLTQLSSVRPPDGGGTYRSAPWRVALSESDINAWLEHRLPGWLRNQDESFRWPAQLSAVRTSWRPGVVFIGVAITSGSDQVISMEIVPRIDERGALWLTVRAARLGRLPVPPSWALSGGGWLPVEALASPEVRGAVEAAMGRRPLAADAAIPVDSVRRVSFIELMPQQARLDVTAQTVADAP
ncbi:hypothetical protein PHYC_00881 [Phycisphaerales bacterium]|nr:hypothetical protein PHYC_00881 [Phycisphaerales bacterium]